jgi:hypothetical protein
MTQLEYGDKWIDARAFLKDLYELIAPYGYRFSRLVPHGKMIAMPARYDYGVEDFRHSTIVLTKSCC